MAVISQPLLHFRVFIRPFILQQVPTVWSLKLCGKSTNLVRSLTVSKQTYHLQPYEGFTHPEEVPGVFFLIFPFLQGSLTKKNSFIFNDI